jgi:hypothetical protein
MALGSTQPLVKMSTRNIPGGKGGRCVRLTISPPLRAEYRIWEPKPPGTLLATPGLLRDSFTFIDCEYNQKLYEEFCFCVGNYKEFRQVLQINVTTDGVNININNVL